MKYDPESREAAVDRKLRSLANYCRHLSRALLDPAMKKRFEDAAKHFDEEAVAFRSARIGD